MLGGKGRDGWTGWVQPVLSPKRYTMICCDCCLAHQMQFKTVTDTRGKIHIRYRIRRANLYTQMLRHKSRAITKLEKKGAAVEALRDGVMVAVLPNELRRDNKKKKTKPRKAKRHG